MAVCDGRSMDVSRLIETDMIRGDYTGTMLYPQYDPNDTYQWYYMSGQDVEDVLLFKGFDTKEDSVKCRWLTTHLDFRFLSVPYLLHFSGLKSTRYSGRILA